MHSWERALGVSNLNNGVLSSVYILIIEKEKLPHSQCAGAFSGLLKGSLGQNRLHHAAHAAHAAHTCGTGSCHRIGAFFLGLLGDHGFGGEHQG